MTASESVSAGFVSECVFSTKEPAGNPPASFFVFSFGPASTLSPLLCYTLGLAV